MIAVPATPATTTAVTNGANSRIEASTKNPPSRRGRRTATGSSPPAGRAPQNPNARVEIIIGNQQSWRAKRNWPMNSPPYGYGGRIAETTVFAVRIIMSHLLEQRLGGEKRPVGYGSDHCSPPEQLPQASEGRSPARSSMATTNGRRMNAPEDYVMGPPFATHNRRKGRSDATREVGTVRGMLPAPLEESASTARPLKARYRVAVGRWPHSSRPGSPPAGATSARTRTSPRASSPSR